MADEKVNMGPEENKPPETQSPPGQGDLPPLEENNAPAVSGEDKAAPDHVEPDPPSADKHTQMCIRDSYRAVQIAVTSFIGMYGVAAGMEGFMQTKLN